MSEVSRRRSIRGGLDPAALGIATIRFRSPSEALKPLDPLAVVVKASKRTFRQLMAERRHRDVVREALLRRKESGAESLRFLSEHNEALHRLRREK